MEKRVAVVTGSSRGIGKAIAVCLARNGFNIVVNGTKKDTVEEIAKEIRIIGAKSLPVVADVSRYSEVRKLVEDTIKEFKRIDVLVNNAGVAADKPLTETTDEELEIMLDTNLKGPLLCCREVLPHMISQRSGCIVNISSGAGKTGFADLSVYCASKFGVIGLTESLAKEVYNYGINVFAICPGVVATDMQKEFMTDAEYQKLKGNMIQPEEVAKKVLKAVEGKYRTGKSIDI